MGLAGLWLVSFGAAKPWLLRWFTGSTSSMPVGVLMKCSARGAAGDSAGAVGVVGVSEGRHVSGEIVDHLGGGAGGGLEGRPTLRSTQPIQSPQTSATTTAGPPRVRRRRAPRFWRKRA